MGVNKVVFNTEDGEQTLIDLTQDTVTPETLATGVTAHAANGEPITGTMESGGGSAPNLGFLVVDPYTEKQEFYAEDEGYDGYDHVIVTGDANLVPENILAGVEIFGVMGTAMAGEGWAFPTLTVINELDMDLLVMGQLCPIGSTTMVAYTGQIDFPLCDYILSAEFSGDAYVDFLSSGEVMHYEQLQFQVLENVGAPIGAFLCDVSMVDSIRFYYE